MDRIGKISQRARKWLFGALLGLCVAISSCSPKIVEKIVVERRDSIITETRIDTMTVTINNTEYIRDWTGLQDTLVLTAEGGAIESKSWIDTAGAALQGELKVKPRDVQVLVPTTNTSEYHQSDSIAVVEVPVEVPVEVKVIPKFWRVMGILGIIETLLLLVFLFLKIKKLLKI